MEHESSYGQRACGVNFNPDQRIDVADMKTAFANIVDVLNKKRFHTEDAEAKRLLSIAITEAQTAQMWAVKAITWNE